MDPQYATVDQLAEITDTMAILRDAILGLGERINGHQAQPLAISGSTPHYYTAPPPPPPYGPTIQQDYTVPPPPPPPFQSAPWAGAFVLHGQTETTPHSIVALAPIIDDTQARIDRIEQRIRSLHVPDGVIGWDGYDELPMAALPVEFRMPDIERYTGIGCPRIMGFQHTNFGSLVQALYGIEEGISRGLWADSSPLDSKGKKPGSGPRLSNVGAIGMTRYWSKRHLPFQR